MRSNKFYMEGLSVVTDIVIHCFTFTNQIKVSICILTKSQFIYLITIQIFISLKFYPEGLKHKKWCKCHAVS